MSTTVLVKKDTIKLLEKAKRILKLRSYDEVIRVAVEKLLNIPDDMFGIDRGRISPFSEGDRLFSEDESED
ncbi:MAG: hypothetical protein ACTSVA_00470 [Candidatus Njordarchaeales archaeon]